MKRYSWPELEKDINGMALNIALSGWMPEYIVGLSPTGVIPAAMLSELLNVTLETVNMGASNCWLAEEAFEQRANILIVLDINNSGNFFDWVITDWQSSAFPNSLEWNDIWHNNVKFAVLVNNEQSEFKEVEFCAHYISRNPTNKVNVKFPWEKE
jgi:hypoxanthine phosphoribosyltransferase